jgi:hypothetical protein
LHKTIVRHGGCDRHGWGHSLMHLACLHWHLHVRRWQELVRASRRNHTSAVNFHASTATTPHRASKTDLTNARGLDACTMHVSSNDLFIFSSPKLKRFLTNAAVWRRVLRGTRHKRGKRRRKKCERYTRERAVVTESPHLKCNASAPQHWQYEHSCSDAAVHHHRFR